MAQISQVCRASYLRCWICWTWINLWIEYFFKTRGICIDISGGQSNKLINIVKVKKKSHKELYNSWQKTHLDQRVCPLVHFTQVYEYTFSTPALKTTKITTGHSMCYHTIWSQLWSGNFQVGGAVLQVSEGTAGACFYFSKRRILRFKFLIFYDRVQKLWKVLKSAKVPTSCICIWTWARH